ncbi:NADH-flavin reductase [Streptomyces sp. AJS327]|uniref:NAD(P)-dependent oxidoreductase n=1 Tax=Streptomyces sp. AJS327 TaxID=2545265 RepID=UPI0015E02796|nr:NAD(P)H-binding protein [Streptomyces sp. AJS327]MBA0053772.1 NADH-flavin reductase [Streptomyces sp. AJS327]
MHITVLGAAGATGSRVVTEALARGHRVTAAVRDARQFAELPPGALPKLADAASPAVVTELSAGQDVIVSAIRPAPGSEDQHPVVARALLDGLAGLPVRLLVVGGAGSLTVPDTGLLAVDDPRYVAPEWRPIALACNHQLDVLRGDSEDVDWTYLSPPAFFAPGKRTGSYRTGGDELLLDADGDSAISMEDFAIALLDEAEHPRHRRTRFTVAH